MQKAVLGTEESQEGEKRKMYINGLGAWSAEQIDAFRNNGRRTVTSDSFTEQMRKASESRKTVEEKTTEPDKEETASADSKNACCEQCRLNSQILTRIMAQNLYGQSGLGSLNPFSGLTGLSSNSTKAMASYQSMMNMLGRNLFT